MTTLREAAQQALGFTLRDFKSLRDFEAARAVLHDALRDALEQQEQEPAIYPDEAREMGLEEVALYTAPPRREWQRLTNEEIYPLYNEPRSDAEMLEFARAVEQALKEKNT
jgi:hypothetical protein